MDKNDLKTLRKGGKCTRIEKTTVLHSVLHLLRVISGKKAI